MVSNFWELLGVGGGKERAWVTRAKSWETVVELVKRVRNGAGWEVGLSELWARASAGRGEAGFSFAGGFLSRRGNNLSERGSCSTKPYLCRSLWQLLSLEHPSLNPECGPGFTFIATAACLDQQRNHLSV